MPEEKYIETGGLRWGGSYWGATNVTFPFAKIQMTTEEINISVKRLFKNEKAFTFSKCDIISIKKKRGLFSVGISIEHSIQEYPSLILFWTLGYNELQKKIENFGYDIFED